MTKFLFLPGQHMHLATRTCRVSDRPHGKAGAMRYHSYVLRVSNIYIVTKSAGHKDFIDIFKCKSALFNQYTASCNDGAFGQLHMSDVNLGNHYRLACPGFILKK